MHVGAVDPERWTVPAVLAHAVHRDPTAPAVAFPEERFTYAELLDSATERACGLAGLGVGKGDHVGILMPNNGDFVVSLYAIALLGAVSVPVNGRFKEVEFGHVAAHGDIRVLLVAPSPGADHAALLQQAFPDLAEQDPTALSLAAAPVLRQVVWSGEALAGTLTPEDLAAAGAAIEPELIRRSAAEVHADDVAVLMYTSGTTARPKGCLLTHGGLTRHGAAVATERFHLGPGDRVWDPLPLFHCGGIVPLLGCLAVGVPFHHAGHFDADVALRVLEQERITVAYPAFETIWNAVVHHPRRPEADLSSLRLIMNIATPDKLRRYEQDMPWARQVTSFGSTECASNLTLTEPDDPLDVRMTTTGRPIGGMEIRIVDPVTGLDLPEGQVGELCFRGDARFLGYYKDPEATAATIDGDGWFHTGDLGSIEEGRLTYHGRLKDMLKVGGENVSALEVESFLSRHPAVALVQVVAMPDEKYGEVAAAFVETVAGADVTEQELIEFCRGRIASYKVPRSVRFVTSWPMSGTKIKKFELRAALAAEAGERS